MSLAALLAVFADARCAGAAAQLLLPDGSVQASCRSFPEPAALLCEALGLARLFPGNESIGRYRMRYWDHRSRREVDQPILSLFVLQFFKGLCLYLSYPFPGNAHHLADFLKCEGAIVTCNPGRVAESLIL